MNYHYLNVYRNGHIVTCTLSNPPTQTLTAGGVSEIHRLLDDIESDISVRVLVFTGAGEGVFISHYEVVELSDSAQRNIETDSRTITTGESEPELS